MRNDTARARLAGAAIGVGTLVFAVVMGPLVKLGLRTLHYDPTKRNEPAHRTPT